MTTTRPGYTDTPMIPGTPWCVHDSRRPHPRVVTPGEAGPHALLSPPSDAVVLFDGSSLGQWENLKGEPAGWKVQNGYMEVVPGTGNIQTKEQFGDCQLHLEFASPTVLEGQSQGRGNSGVFLMARYEIQVLDGYDNPTYADGQTGAIYGQYPPRVNACRAPGQWQSYDIIWIAPRFEGTQLASPARLTLLHNGLLLHHDQPLMWPTTHRQLSQYTPHPALGPLMLQDHRNPVRFRNIWYRPLKGYDE